jgi:hypothetical protein
MSEFADSRTDLSSSTIEIMVRPPFDEPPCHNIVTARKLSNLCFCIVITIPYGNLNNPAAARARASGVNPARTP